MTAPTTGHKVVCVGLRLLLRCWVRPIDQPTALGGWECSNYRTIAAAFIPQISQLTSASLGSLFTVGLLISFAFSLCFARWRLGAFQIISRRFMPREPANGVLRKRDPRDRDNFARLQLVLQPDVPFMKTWLSQCIFPAYSRAHFVTNRTVSSLARPRVQAGLAPRLVCSSPESTCMYRVVQLNFTPEIEVFFI